MLTRHPVRALFAALSLFAVVSLAPTSGAALGSDWPMWGYDAARSDASPAAVDLPEALHLQWTLELPAPRRAWRQQLDDRDKLEFDKSYSPIVLDGRLFVASMTNDSLTCYDARSGERLWRFYADGPMRLAPAAADGRVFAPSDDGRLYCLDAETGEALWSFDARPADHRVLGNERIVSMWPARGGPVVKDGTVYFAAGIWPFLGVFAYALDAETGRVEWANTTPSIDWQHQPHGGADAFAGVAPQGYLAASGDRLVVSGGRSYPALVDRADGQMMRSKVRGRKGDGGYRVRIQGEHYFNHGDRYRLEDGGDAGSGRVEHAARAALDDRLAAVRDQVEGEVFERIVAGGRLYVTTTEGRIYCFGGGSVDNPPLLSELASPPGPSEGEAGRLADEILSQTGQTDGYALALGAGNVALLEQLAARSSLRIVALEPDAETVAAARRRLDESGLYGERVAVIPGTFNDSHYPAYVSSLVVAADPAAAGIAPDADTLERVYQRLRPYTGRAWLAFDPEEPATSAALSAFRPENGSASPVPGAVVLASEGPLPDSGQWTHQHADSAQTVVSRDYRVRPPFGPIWFGGPTHHNILPRHAAGPRPHVSGGRVVLLGVETVSARCVYTGRELWVREFAGIGHPFTNLTLEEHWARGEEVYMTNQPGATYIGSPYVSLPDAIYVRYQGRVHRLDPDTGETVGQWELPARETANDGEAPDWGHISVSGDTVVATTNPHIFRGGALGTLGDDQWDGTSSERIVALDRHTGEVRWTRDAEIGFRHNAIASGNGRLFVNDLLSENAVEMALRRGMRIAERPRLYALDIETGEEMWSQESEVFGTFLSYSPKHDVLLEGGTRDGRRYAEDEPDRRMLARRGSDGEALWHRLGSFNGPVILRDDAVFPGRPGQAICLLSGGDPLRPAPFSDEDIPWSYWKTYGCGTSNASPHLLLFRSGSAGFADLEHGSGTGTLGGFRSGCTSNLIAADGVLNAPDYTRTCTCSYQNQTSLGLIHMPEMEMWTVDRSVVHIEGGVSRLGVNLGAPGERRAENGTHWIPYPQTAAPTTRLNATLSTQDVDPRAARVASAIASSSREGENVLADAGDTLDGETLATHWRMQCDGEGVLGGWIKYEFSEAVDVSNVEAVWNSPAGTRLRIEASDFEPEHEGEFEIDGTLHLPLPSGDWSFNTDIEDRGRDDEWHAVEYDDSEWDDISIGQSWTHFGPYSGYTGPAWYRRTVTLPERPGGVAPEDLESVRLAFGAVDEMGWVWMNGHYLGEHDLGLSGWDKPFSFDVADIVRWGEENHIAVRAENTRGGGGIWRPVHLVLEAPRQFGDRWQTVYEGASESGLQTETFDFAPTRAREVRLRFLEHDSVERDSRGRGRAQELSVYNVRIGGLQDPDAYADFIPPHGLFRDHSLFVDGSNGLNWVAASGYRGVRLLRLNGVGGGGRPYRVALHFSEPDGAAPGERVFQVRLQGETVAESVDVARQAGGSRRALELSFPSVSIEGDLTIELGKLPESALPPVLSGVEIAREGD